MEPGTLLAGRYRIEAELASGGMGVVYEATQLPLGRSVAIKVLRRDLLKQGTFLARLRREAQTVANLKHPNIVDVTDLVIEDKLAFFVMELLAGNSFGSEIAREGKVEEELVAVVGSDVLAALAYAHGLGLIHRDVKPDNIFLTKAGGVVRAKLLDFGLVKVDTDERLTATNAVLGTWQYMAPEQARGEGLDARTDVYALGACLYYALTKKRPYQAAGVEAPIFALTDGLVAPPIATFRPDITPELAHVIHRALEKDPAKRWRAAREMREAMTPFVRVGRAPSPSTHSTLESISRSLDAVLPPARGEMALRIDEGGILDEVTKPSPSRSPEPTHDRDASTADADPTTAPKEDVRDMLPTHLDPARGHDAYAPTINVSAEELSVRHLVESEASARSVELVSVKPEPAENWPPPVKPRAAKTTAQIASRGQDRATKPMRWFVFAALGVVVFAGGILIGHYFFP